MKSICSFLFAAVLALAPKVFAQTSRPPALPVKVYPRQASLEAVLRPNLFRDLLEHFRRNPPDKQPVVHGAQVVVDRA